MGRLQQCFCPSVFHPAKVPRSFLPNSPQPTYPRLPPVSINATRADLAIRVRLPTFTTASRPDETIRYTVDLLTPNASAASAGDNANLYSIWEGTFLNVFYMTFQQLPSSERCLTTVSVSQSFLIVNWLPEIFWTIHPGSLELLYRQLTRQSSRVPGHHRTAGLN